MGVGCSRPRDSISEFRQKCIKYKEEKLNREKVVTAIVWVIVLVVSIVYYCFVLQDLIVNWSQDRELGENLYFLFEMLFSIGLDVAAFSVYACVSKSNCLVLIHCKAIRDEWEIRQQIPSFKKNDNTDLKKTILIYVILVIIRLLIQIIWTAVYFHSCSIHTGLDIAGIFYGFSWPFLTSYYFAVCFLVIRKWET